MIRWADAIHLPLPGDVGLLGLLLALIQQKPIFVRHCGTWGESITITDRIIFWLLESIAGGRNVVLATGESDVLPSKKNPNIAWIFSTSLTKAELENVPTAKMWSPTVPLRLITVCRLTESKNVQAILRALPLIQQIQPDVHLDVLGDGEHRSALEAMAADLHISSAISFYGNVNHESVLQALSRAHIFVFPTQVKEGFPKAVLEALACGLPIIASNISVLPSLVRDCGLTLEAPTCESVSHAVLELLSNPDQLNEMSRIARQKAKHYTLEAWQEKIAAHLYSSWGIDFSERTAGA
jgi:glycosyltransferase involved in cell wall biosynthesis